MYFIPVSGNHNRCYEKSKCYNSRYTIGLPLQFVCRTFYTIKIPAVFSNLILSVRHILFGFGGFIRRGTLMGTIDNSFVDNELKAAM